jgi:hypothetical protein
VVINEEECYDEKKSINTPPASFLRFVELRELVVPGSSSPKSALYGPTNVPGGDNRILKRGPKMASCERKNNCVHV